jgi:23S rRNA (cytidine1920-2'-O)/16S rRNA (cytidine1409-2'-O)-methyltransferase
VVRDPAVWSRTIDEVIEAGAALGLGARAVMASPLPGPAGNIEFVLQLGPGTASGADVAAAVGEGTQWSA